MPSKTARNGREPGLRTAAYEMQKEAIAVKPPTPDLLEAILDEMDRLAEALACLRLRGTS